MALVDIYVSALLQFGVGVGSFYGIPTFRFDTPAVWSAMAMAIRVATLLFFVL